MVAITCQWSPLSYRPSVPLQETESGTAQALRALTTSLLITTRTWDHKMGKQNIVAHSLILPAKLSPPSSRLEDETASQPSGSERGQSSGKLCNAILLCVTIILQCAYPDIFFCPVPHWTQNCIPLSDAPSHGFGTLVL